MRAALGRAFTRPRPIRVGDRVRTVGYPAVTGRVEPWPRRPAGTRLVLVAARPGSRGVREGWRGVYGLSAVRPDRALRLPWQH